MKTIFVSTLILLIIFIASNTSYSVSYWAKTYGGEYYDQPKEIQQTADGGLIVAGYSSFYESDVYDITVLKLDTTGNVAWGKTYGCDGEYENFKVRSIQQTSDGGCLVVGGCAGQFTASNICVLKLDSNGNRLWQHKYGTWAYHYIMDFCLASASSIQQTSDGGYIVVGNDYYRAALIIKVDASGNVIWQNHYNISVGETSNIQQTEDGGYILLADTSILKLDSNGNALWMKYNYHEEIGIDMTLYSIQQTSDGGYIVAGRAEDTSLSVKAIIIIKINNSGNVSWSKTYGDSSIGYYAHSSIQQTLDGGYIVVGSTDSFGAGSSDILILKLDQAGNVSWQRTYGGSGYEDASSVQQTLDGGYIVVGSTDSFGAGFSDFFVLKLTMNGEIPDCGIMDTSNINTMETSVEVSDGNTNFWPVSSPCSDNACFITSQDTSVETYVACCYDSDDLDTDGRGDGCDNCPENYNPGQEDADDDGTGNVCDPDDDNDGICDPGVSAPSCSGSDVCPYDPENDIDEDSICGDFDNCPVDYNPNQEDNFPTQGNGLGDTCDCEGNFDCDGDCDGSDAFTFKIDFGRSAFDNPCESGDPCNGDFDCDGDCDGTDASGFKVDFGRSSFNNPCPACEVGEWCVYQ